MMTKLKQNNDARGGNMNKKETLLQIFDNCQDAYDKLQAAKDQASIASSHATECLNKYNEAKKEWEKSTMSDEPWK